ncbi:MAG TPA: addiction module killer protein [Solibacterales bacterium]|nr:addiction module killer protein [Bryobacterales bacterium]
MEALPREVEFYVDGDGNCPFKEWLESLKDHVARAQVDKRITRVRLGLFGNCDEVGEGVIELKLDTGPGYRLYCAQDGRTLVVLLCGGTKRRQQSDIEQARKFWRDYKS